MYGLDPNYTDIDLSSDGPFTCRENSIVIVITQQARVGQLVLSLENLCSYDTAAHRMISTPVNVKWVGDCVWSFSCSTKLTRSVCGNTECVSCNISTNIQVFPTPRLD